MYNKCYNCTKLIDLSGDMTGLGNPATDLGFASVHDKYNISENIFVSNYDKMMLNKYFPEQYYKSIDGQIAQGDSLDALGSHGGSQSLGRLAHHSFDSGATPIEGPTIIQKDTELELPPSYVNPGSGENNSGGLDSEFDTSN